MISTEIPSYVVTFENSDKFVIVFSTYDVGETLRILRFIWDNAKGCHELNVETTPVLDAWWVVYITPTAIRLRSPLHLLGLKDIL